MKKLTKYSPCSLHFYSWTIKKNRNIIILLILSMGIMESSISQRFFSPNTKITINQQKSDAFIKATPEIALKAEYYNVSKAVLETILVLQSNGGTTISDGLYNYSRVLPNPQLTGYPAFSKTKNGYILCSTRSRGVEATALSLSLMRNDGKNSLSEVQWLSLVFGQDGELKSLIQQADEIYTARTGKSFIQLGLNFANNQVAVDINKSELPTDVEIVEKQQSKTKEKEDKTELPLTKLNESKSTDPMPEPVPFKNKDIKTNPETEKTEISNSKKSAENNDPQPVAVATAKVEVIIPKEESKTIIEPEIKTSEITEKSKNPMENPLITDDPKPRASNANIDKSKPIPVTPKTDESTPISETTNSKAVNNKEVSPTATDPNPINASKAENTKVTNSTTQPNNVQQNKNSLYQTETYKPKHGRAAWSLYGGLKIFDMEKNPRDLTLMYVDESPSRDNLNSTVTVDGNQAYHVGIRYQNNRDDVNFRFLIDGQGYFGSINGLALGLGGGFRLNDKGGFIIQPEITGVIGYGAKGVGTIQNNDIYIKVNDTKFQDHTNVRVAVENYFVGIKPGLSFSFRTGYKSEIGIGASYQISYKRGSVTFSGTDDSEKSVSDSENLTEPNVTFLVNQVRTDKVPFNPDGLEFKLFFSF